MQSMGCHSVSEQHMAAGATEEDVNKISQVMAKTVQTLEIGTATLEPGSEAHSLPCEVVGTDEEFSNGVCITGLAKWTPKNKKPSRGACQTPSRKRCDWRRNATVPFYLARFRVGEADNPGPAHATAKLFGEQFEAIGHWSTNLTSKSEMELTPLLAQVGECRHIFSETSVSQNILGTHSHMDSFPLLVSTEPDGDYTHSTIQ